MKKILVTGSLGYIGSVLTRRLKERGYDCVGYDCGLFQDCTFGPADDSSLVGKDVRDLTGENLKGVSAVVHLAGVSNDPFGNLKPEVVYDPTRAYAFELAKLCKERGIKFIFASSCSIYGKGSGGLLNEDSEVFPQTPYSLNKVQIEQDLATITDQNFTPVCLRFATVFGLSPRIRFDVFVNMMTGMAVSTGNIILNSDGKAWRPSLHIEDACQSVIHAIESDYRDSKPLILNVGSTSENHQIRQVAELIASKVPGCKVLYLKEMQAEKGGDFADLIKDRKLQDYVDSRTYEISFEKILRIFPNFKCQWTVEAGVEAMIRHFTKMPLTEEVFKSINYYRLQKIEHLFKTGRISEELKWLA